MTCLLLDSVAGLSMESPLRVAALAGTWKTATPTSTTRATGATSAASATTAGPSTSPAKTPAFPVIAGSAVQRCVGLCNRSLPATREFFYRNDSATSGLRKTCIECCRERQRRARRSATGNADVRLFPDLPAAPLGRVLVRMVERERSALRQGVVVPDARTGRGGRVLDDARRRVCSHAAIENRRLWAWEHGETRSVKFDVADRVLQRLGLLWWDVWVPCPGDAWHFVMVDAQGWCPSCEAFCVAERAFAPEFGIA